jgi:hypothetical protein
LRGGISARRLDEHHAADPHHSRRLLIVGERDHTVIELNRQAMEKLSGETRLKIVPRASHLFEEPRTLEQVAHLARTGSPVTSYPPLKTYQGDRRQSHSNEPPAQTGARHNYACP